MGITGELRNGSTQRRSFLAVIALASMLVLGVVVGTVLVDRPDSTATLEQPPPETDPTPRSSEATTVPDPTEDGADDPLTEVESSDDAPPPVDDEAASYPDPSAVSSGADLDCTQDSGTLPDGVWFGQLQSPPGQGYKSYWEADEVEFKLYCLYGGQAARDLAATRLDTLAPESNYYVVRSRMPFTTYPVAANAQARELIDLSGTIGPAFPWSEGPEQSGPFVANGCCNQGWIHIQDGAIVEFAVGEHDHLITHSYLGPGDQQCVDNGMSRTARWEVNEQLPAVGSNGGLDVYADPGFDARLVGTVPFYSFLFIAHPCEMMADGQRWWLLEWNGALVWGPADSLRLFDTG